MNTGESSAGKNPRRFYGKYRGLVIANIDPEQIGLNVNCVDAARYMTRRRGNKDSRNCGVPSGVSAAAGNRQSGTAIAFKGIVRLLGRELFLTTGLAGSSARVSDVGGVGVRFARGGWAVWIVSHGIASAEMLHRRQFDRKQIGS